MSEFTVVQIIPPSFHLYLHSLAGGSFHDQPDRDKPAPEYFTARNGLLIAKNLVQPFLKCEFGIDVDDGYRIVQFHKSDTLDLSSYTRLNIAPDTDSELRPSDFFLTHRFILAVQSSLPNGGEVDGFDPGWLSKEVADFLDPEGPLVDEDDDRWNNLIGQEVKRVQLHQLLSRLQGSNDNATMMDSV